jgi:hypothetical protein
MPHSSEYQAGIRSPNRRASNNINAQPTAWAITTTPNTFAFLLAIPPQKSAAPHEAAVERLRAGETRFGIG